MTKLNSMLKSRNISLLIKLHIVKAIVFPVVMYRWESWTVKKAEHRRIDASELWCWRKLLRVPWTIRRFIYRKSTLNIHWKDGCWSFNTLATWWKEWTHWKRPWCWETLKAGGEGDDKRWDGWMASLTRWTWVWANSRRWWRTEKPELPHPWGCKELDMTEGLSNPNLACSASLVPTQHSWAGRKTEVS